jgi:hypothetical protein
MGVPTVASLMLDAVCRPSENVVARVIEGEVIIVPLTSGVGDVEDELYTLNPTGQAIWQKLDGKRTLKDVAALLEKEFDRPIAEIEHDVLGFSNELAARLILTVKTEG